MSKTYMGILMEKKEDGTFKPEISIAGSPNDVCKMLIQMNDIIRNIFSQNVEKLEHHIEEKCENHEDEINEIFGKTQIGEKNDKN